VLSLKNDQLDVSILHPVEDRERLGSRYCVGGYVYQVTDNKLGDLVSGPGYPSEARPPVFDGQGLPEAFRAPLWFGMEESAAPRALPPVGTEMLVMGVGRVHLPADIRKMPVDEFAAWSIAEEPGKVTMRTRQELAGWALEITRTLRLVNRTLISETRLANVAENPLPYWWFPHPFFPLVLGESSRFNLPIRVPANSAYTQLDNGFVALKAEAGWNRGGHFQELEFEPGERLVALQRHPKVGLVATTFSYTPTYFPIWGNANTFSFEPYTEGIVAPGASAEWSVAYDF
jgi:hypothetical protein